MSNNPITSIRVDLRAKLVRIGYVHPENPFEDLCFEIQDGEGDIDILQDFLEACSLQNRFEEISQAKAKRFCRNMYKDIVETWLKDSTDLLLKKAAHALTVEA